MKGRRGHRAAGLLRLVRIGNVATIAGGAALGGLLALHGDAAGGVAVGPLALAALSAALVGAGGNAFNDLADLPIDRVNRPRRPLPSGRVAPGTARVLWLLLTAAGVALGAALSLRHGLLAVGAALVLFAYSRWLKRRPLAGNVAIALLIALALVYGGWAVGNGAALWVGAAFAFLTTLAREMVKCVEDVAGDAAGGARTVAVAWGVEKALWIARALVGLTLVLLPVPYMGFGFAPLYLLAATAAGGALLAALVHLHATPRAARKGAAALKASMLLGMAALALG